MAITLTDNQFFTGLTNLALFMRLYATNTSKLPDNFIDSFATEILGNGDTKIFTFSDLPAVTDYSETSTVLTPTKVDTTQEVLRISEKKVIKSSYSSYILTMAFASDSGMNNFIGYVMGQMESAKTSYLYDQIITDLFSKTWSKETQNISVPLFDVSALNEPLALNNAELYNQKQIALAVQDTTNNIQIYTDAYNSKGYKQALNVSDMKFLFCNPYNNESVINLFATLYNSSEVKNNFEKPERYVIPQLAIPENNETVIGWLMHKYAYQFFYKFVTMLTFFDVSNLMVNNFLHFWYGKGWLDNLPVVKFTASTRTTQSE